MWIYKLTNSVNGKIYVGKTVDLKARLYMHSRAYDKGCAIHRAIRKHGWNSFSVDVLEEGVSTEQALCALEIEWIKKLNATDRRHGYNLTAGGDGLSGYKHSEQTRAAWSKQRKGRRPSERCIAAFLAYARSPRTAEHNAKIAAAKLGTRLSEEAKQKISKARTKLIACGDEMLSVQQLSARSGVGVDAIRWRLRQGWPIKKVLQSGWGGRP